MENLVVFIALTLSLVLAVQGNLPPKYVTVGPNKMTALKNSCANLGSAYTAYMNIYTPACTELAGYGLVNLWTNARGGNGNKNSRKFYFNFGNGNLVKQTNGQAVWLQNGKTCLILDVATCVYKQKSCQSTAFKALCKVKLDGQWTPWSQWSSCSASCGGGTRLRSRTCTDPAPAHGGNNCVGQATQNQACNSQTCPTPGGWTDWSEWRCSCEGDFKRYRDCSNPKPDEGGPFCAGASFETNSTSCNYTLPDSTCYETLMIVNNATGDYASVRVVKMDDNNPTNCFKSSVFSETLPIGFYLSGKAGLLYNDPRRAFFYNNANNTGSWEEGSHLRPNPVPETPTATVIGNKLYITGGVNSGDVNANQISTLDSTDVFEDLSPTVLPRTASRHELVAMNETHAIFLGGDPESDDSYIFDSTSKTFTPLPVMPDELFLPVAGLATFPDGKRRLAVSGEDNNFEDALYIFDFDTQTWTDHSQSLSVRLLRDMASIQFKDTFISFYNETTYEFNPFTYDFVEREENVNLSDQTAFLVPDDYVTCP